MKARTKLFLERITMAAIFLGLIFLCQPYSMTLYARGFPILFLGTLAFIIVSRLRVREG